MIFVTTHAYELGQALGVEGAIEQFYEQLASPSNESLPVVRTITRLRTLDEVQLWIDPGATRIAESRSRAFHAAMQSDADVWFSCDDDCEASLETCDWMLEAVRGQSVICSAPYWCRLSTTQPDRISIQIAELGGQLPEYRQLSRGGRTMPMLYGGFGLIAMSRRAMTEMWQANADLTYTDKEGTVRLALFLETIESGTWLGEDLAFFRRLPPSVKREALVSGHTVHAGRLLDLRTLGADHANDDCPVTTRS